MHEVGIALPQPQLRPLTVSILSRLARVHVSHVRQPMLQQCLHVEHYLHIANSFATICI